MAKIQHSPGDTTFIARTHLNNGEWVYSKDGPRQEFATLASAEQWLERALRDLRENDDRWWGTIDKGTYRDTSFRDARYGRVKDTTWEPDSEFYWEESEAVGAA